MKRKYIGVFCAFTIMTSFNAAAQDISFEVPFFERSEQSIKIDNLDIIGFYTGMNLQDARALAQREYGSIAEASNSTSHSIAFPQKEVSIRSNGYYWKFNASKQSGPTSDKISVSASSPLSGSRVLGVWREVSIESYDNQPMAAESIAKLINKYGTPSIKTEDGTGYTLCWNYQGNKLISGKQCEDFTVNFTMDGVRYAGINGADVDIRLNVYVHKSQFSADRVSKLRFFLIDAKTYRDDLVKYKDFVDAKIEAIKEKEAAKQPGAVPKL